MDRMDLVKGEEKNGQDGFVVREKRRMYRTGLGLERRE